MIHPARIEPRLLAHPRAQRGAALVISLIMLVVITLVGLASIRSTQLQEGMSGNMYDRSLAFQRAESGLRAAEKAITDTVNITTLNGVDCSPTTGVLCRMVPASTFTSTNTNWSSVSADYDVNNSATPGDPQYHIQLMGTGKANSSYDVEANADHNAYGNIYPPNNVAYFRVTARSSNPGTAQSATSDRSVVVLQTTIKRPY